MAPLTFDTDADKITYAPDTGFTGTDTFEYQICDTAGNCDTATVTVVVNPSGNNPFSQDDQATTEEDFPVTITVLDNDDPHAVATGALIVSDLTDPSMGSAAINLDNKASPTPPTPTSTATTASPT